MQTKQVNYIPYCVVGFLDFFSFSYFNRVLICSTSNSSMIAFPFVVLLICSMMPFFEKEPIFNILLHCFMMISICSSLKIRRLSLILEKAFVDAGTLVVETMSSLYIRDILSSTVSFGMDWRTLSSSWHLAFDRLLILSYTFFASIPIKMLLPETFSLTSQIEMSFTLISSVMRQFEFSLNFLIYVRNLNVQLLNSGQLDRI